MLSGFECDEDQTGWLAGLAVWSAGAAAGCLLASATLEPALPHWQVLALALAVSVVSLGVRLPVMLSQCSDRTWLVHAVWMLGVFAQINWAGFLAARASTEMISAEVILICLGLELWLLSVFVPRGQLPWLQQYFVGYRFVDSVQPPEVKQVHRETAAPAELAHRLPGASPFQGEVEGNENPAANNINRQSLDAIDDDGQRYLSGSVRVQFESEQRTETFVLSFCPALDGIAQVELECDSEDVIAKVEHATETGARITVRRSNVGASARATIEWYATGSQREHYSTNLP